MDVTPELRPNDEAGPDRSPITLPDDARASDPRVPGMDFAPGEGARSAIAAVGGDFVAALQAACDAAAATARCVRATVRLIEGPQLRVWAETSARVPVERVPIATSMEGLAVRERQLVLCDDATTDERADPETSRWLDARSWLVLPLLHGEEVVGTLSVSDSEPGAFGASPEQARAMAEELRAIVAALAGHLQTAAWLLDRDRALDVMQAQINETQITAEMMSEGVIVFDRAGGFLRANNAAARLLGINLQKLAGRKVGDALRTLVREDGSEWPGNEQPPAMTLATGASFRDVIMGVHRPEGVPRWVSVSSRVLPDAHGAPNGVVVVVSDCSERRGLREQLAHATLHDEATGLPNRRLLHLELDDTIDRSRRQGLGSALVHVVLSDFESVRAHVGAHAADEALRALGERLVQIARDGEMVARDGDDQFATVLGMLGDSERATSAFIDRVRGRLVEPIDLGRTTVTFQAGLIVSVFPRDGRTAEALLRHAALERLNERQIAA